MWIDVTARADIKALQKEIKKLKKEVAELKLQLDEHASQTPTPMYPPGMF